MDHRITRLGIGLSALLVAACALIASTTSLPPAQRQALEALQRDSSADPRNPSLHYSLASRYLAAGERAAALNSLRQAFAQGDGFLPPRDLGLAGLNGDPIYERLRAEMEAALPRVNADAPRTLTLADKAFLPEGIAYDAASKRFFLGSTIRRQIVAVSEAGGAAVFSTVTDALDSVLGLVVDSARNELLAVSTNGFTETDQTKRRNTVVIYDLKTGAQRQRIEFPQAQQLNDLAVAPDGTMYVSDTLAGRVWKVAASRTAVNALTAAGAIRGANGIALAPDTGHLYVAAGRYVARVSTETGESTPLPLPARQTLAAVDGLYWHMGTLIGVHNSTNPGRVVRAHLAQDGLTVSKVETLLSHHHPDILEPTTGVIVGTTFHLLATTNVTAMGPKGEIDASITLRPPVVLSIPVPPL
jgi:hypothetical protein